EGVKASIYNKTYVDVEKALQKDSISLDDFMALLSPAAEKYLEQLALKSSNITQNRFGKTIQLFAPFYLSNECNNICTYCGFSLDNKIKRKTLTSQEILQEAKAIKEKGFNHVLLVTGEANHTVHLDYFLRAIELINSIFSNISIEVQPLEEKEYVSLQNAGVYSVLLYQETYNRESYAEYHPKGKKSNFNNRILTAEKIGNASFHKIGLGVLLGLEDWRVDTFFCALHLNYLKKKYWKTKFSISFPRIRPAEGIIEPKIIVNDKNLVQLITAYRLLEKDLELSLSTRESQKFRNHAIPLGITVMSAESKTNPGGYSVEKESLKQFEISDDRSIEEVKNIILNCGYQPVLKDWEKQYVGL
ncbi:MAG: 2-iminoacetate synthase ThiH, partial [Solirubrobacteraceae bacterium]